MSDLKLIPSEMLTLIPLYGGDKRLLNLFLRKCEYVINIYKGVNNPQQDVYVMHAVTSRLTGDAAATISLREDDLTWDELKALLIQRFGDHRTEESIAMELEHIQIYQGESYIDFYNRIQSTKTVLLTKVNQTNSSYKDLRISMYNSKALDAFLYSLPEYLFCHVRQKNPETLEKALEIVVEELNFYEQYNLKNKGHNPHLQNNYRPPKPIVFPNGPTRPQSGGTLFGGSSSTFGATAAGQPQSLTFGATTASKLQSKALAYGVSPVNVVNPPKPKESTPPSNV